MAGKQEDTDSLYNIGLIYYYGYDKYANYIIAIEFFEKSSKLNIIAKHNICWRYVIIKA